jgi:hypothetical protein
LTRAEAVLRLPRAVRTSLGVTFVVWVVVVSAIIYYLILSLFSLLVKGESQAESMARGFYAQLFNLYLSL